MRLGSDFAIEWDANVGRSMSRPIPGFSEVSLQHEALDGAIEVRGNRVTYSASVGDAHEMLARLHLLLFSLLACLGAELPEPPYVTRIEGAIGEASYSLEQLEAVTPIVVLDDGRSVTMRRVLSESQAGPFQGEWRPGVAERCARSRDG